MAFTILTVCSGNVCRSPLAELLLRKGLASLPDVTVSSVGTVALVGQGMPDEGQSVARELGVEPGEHRARLLAEEQVREAGLVLAMAREHRSAVAELHPRAARRAFTLTEFANIARQVEDSDFDEVRALPLDDVTGKLAAIVDVAASLRGVVEHLDEDDMDVVDPYRQGREVYELSAAQLKPAVDATVGFLMRAATISPSTPAANPGLRN